ncbi:MAG: insulinase family protein [Crenarchaeota archaeon]|nr:insulinase family protein [Thermoproteota archaeon]
MWKVPKVKITKYTLENKLKVILHKRKHLTVHYRLLMPHGFRNETFPESVHLLEHMLFKPEHKVFPTFQRIGGEVNGYVSMDEFGIYWIVPTIFQKEAIDCIGKILLENFKSWTDDMLKREKAIIIRELEENFSDPTRYIDIFLRRKLFGEDTPGTHSPDTVEKAFRDVSLADVRSELENMSPNGSVLAAVGNVEMGKLEPLEIWRSALESKKSWKQLKTETDLGYHFEYRDLPINYLALGWISAPKGEYHSEILNLLGAILTAFPTSRLYRRLRVEEGLVYHVEAFNVAFIDTGFFAIATSTPPHHVNRAINIILEEIDDIITNGPTEEEVQDMKNMFFGALYSLTDSKSGLASVLAYDELFLNDALRLYKEIAKTVQNLKPEAVQSTARRYLKLDRCTICILGREYK